MAAPARSSSSAPSRRSSQRAGGGVSRRSERGTRRCLGAFNFGRPPTSSTGTSARIRRCRGRRRHVLPVVAFLAGPASRASGVGLYCRATTRTPGRRAPRAPNALAEPAAALPRRAHHGRAVAARARDIEPSAAAAGCPRSPATALDRQRGRDSSAALRRGGHGPTTRTSPTGPEALRAAFHAARRGSPTTASATDAGRGRQYETYSPATAAATASPAASAIIGAIRRDSSRAVAAGPTITATTSRFPSACTPISTPAATRASRARSAASGRAPKARALNRSKPTTRSCRWSSASAASTTVASAAVSARSVPVTEQIAEEQVLQSRRCRRRES